MKTLSVLFGCAGSIAMSGCASFPNLPNEPRVSIHDIIENVECEIQNAIYVGFPDFPWIVEWAAGITLVLNTETTGGGGAEFGFAAPLNPGTFNLGLGAGLSGQNTSNGSFSYSLYLDDLADEPLEFCLKRSPSILTGPIGVGSWITQAATGVSVTGNVPKDMSYSIEFVIKANGGGSAGFTLIPVGDATVGGGISLAATHQDSHKLTVTLTEADKKVTAGATEARRRARLRKGLPVDRPAETARTPVDAATQSGIENAEMRTILRGIDNELD